MNKVDRLQSDVNLARAAVLDIQRAANGLADKPAIQIALDFADAIRATVSNTVTAKHKFQPDAPRCIKCSQYEGATRTGRLERRVC